MAAQGLLLKEDTVVDAAIIATPCSTRNRGGKRDPDMHQTQKGKQSHFGMKAHIDIDAVFGIAHTLLTTPANASDVTQAHESRARSSDNLAD